MAQVSKLVDLQELQTALARATFLALQGEEWVVAHRSFLEAGQVRFGTNDFARADGSRGSVPSTREILDLWPRLRAAMTDGDAGTWLSAELEITPQGRFDFTFNWDRRPFMNTRSELLDPQEPGAGPTDDDWREDLRIHPRAADRTPAWLAAIVAAGSTDGAAASAPEIDPGRMQTRFAALLDQPGWSDVGAAVLRHTVEQLRTGDFVWTDAEDLPEGDPEVQRLVEEVARALIREQLDTATMGAIVDLHAGAVAAGAASEVVGSEAIDRAAPGSEHRAGAANRVWSGVVEVVGGLTEALVGADA